MIAMFGIFGKKEEPYVSILAGTEDEPEEFEGEGLLVSAVSDVGFIRKGNEDSFYADGIGVKPEENCLLSKRVGGHERYIFAVCDGMGGEAYGEIASNIAVTSLDKHSDVIRCVSLEGLHSAVNDYADAANAAICRMAEQKKCGRSGSTLALVCIDNGTVYSFNLGDSRVYFYRGGSITRLSQDHSLAAQKHRDGELTAEIRNSSDAHKLITFLGVDDDSVGLTAYASEPVELGDGRVLICSDGLTDMCSDEEIAKVLGEDHTNYSEALAEKALSKGGWDNVTCIVISKA